MTEAEIREKVKELAALQKQADDIHISVMMEVGHLVNAVQSVRGYQERTSAEMEVSRMLKGAGMIRCGEQYVRGCWQLVFKLTDADRKKIKKYQLSVEDIKALCNMDIDKGRQVLQDIRDQKITPAWGKQGMTYHIRSMSNPSIKGKRRTYSEMIDLTKDPGVISAKVFRQGTLDEMALEDLLANIYSRIDYDTVEKCRASALRRAGRAVA